jgi:hypothetical protein
MNSIAKKVFVVFEGEIPFFFPVGGHRKKNKKCSPKFEKLGGPSTFDDLYLEIYIVACYFYCKIVASFTFPPLYL